MKKRWVLVLPVLGLLALLFLLLLRSPLGFPTPWKTAPAPAGSSEEPSAKSYKLIYPSPATSPAEAVPTAPAPVPRRMRLSLVAHDGRPLKSCRVIALGRDRVIGDYDPDENGAG